MKPVPETERTCANCVHKNDSGTEFCGGCSGDPPHAWTEDPYHVEERADKEIAKLKKQIATLETDAKGYDIQFKEILERAKLAEARLALIRERWSAWQKVRVLGICIGERMRLPGAAPDAIIDALDEACQG
jgi:hypothetical protein